MNLGLRDQQGLRFDNVVFIICASRSGSGHQTPHPASDQPTLDAMFSSLSFLTPLPSNRLVALSAVVAHAGHGVVRNGAPPGVRVS
jgi:hypothetical protein